MKKNIPKIALVASSAEQILSAGGLVSLFDTVEMTSFVFSSPKLSLLRGISSPLMLFDEVTEMPGYMRGLEDCLAGFDAVIGCEAYSLASFQAMRAAMKYRKPFGCIVSGTDPLGFVDFPNIRAIKSDLINRSDLFWPTSAAAKKCLQDEGVGESKIVEVYPSIASLGFKFSQGNRDKFRRYVKLLDSDVVALVEGPLDYEKKPQMVIEALSILRRAGCAHLPKLKVVFAGDGPLSKDLRYQASDAKVGENCLFMSQDTTPFLRDLFAATDILISLRSHGPTSMPHVTSTIMAAMASGVHPIVNHGTPEAEWVSRVGTILDHESPAALAIALAKRLTQDEQYRAVRRVEVEDWSNKVFGAVNAAPIWGREVSRLLTIGDQRNSTSPVMTSRLRMVSTLIEEGKAEDALVEIENLLLSEGQSQRIRAELFCLKGEVCHQGGNFEGSLAAYQSALETGEENDRIYRGLGFLSLKSHSHEESITFFKRALGKNTEDSQSMLGIAMVYRRLSLFGDSLYWAEQCLRRTPSNIAAILLASQTAMETQSTTIAIEALERIRDLTSDNRNVLISLAQLYLRIGRLEKANALLKLAGQPLVASLPRDKDAA